MTYRTPPQTNLLKTHLDVVSSFAWQVEQAMALSVLFLMEHGQTTSNNWQTEIIREDHAQSLARIDPNKKGSNEIKRHKKTKDIKHHTGNDLHMSWIGSLKTLKTHIWDDVGMYTN